MGFALGRGGLGLGGFMVRNKNVPKENKQKGHYDKRSFAAKNKKLFRIIFYFV